MCIMTGVLVVEILASLVQSKWRYLNYRYKETKQLFFLELDVLEKLHILLISMACMSHMGDY